MRYLREHDMGFSSFEILHADMTLTPLPEADLILVKDTLQHLPNMDIMRFLIRQIYTLGDRPARFKYAMFVEDDCEENEQKNIDIPPQQEHSWHCLDLSAEPFNLQVKRMFGWRDSNPAWTRVKIARVLSILDK